ncbi:MAG: alpha/beta fold hydrolase, partial [Opitutaceae bacterium]
SARRREQHAGRVRSPDHPSRSQLRGIEPKEIKNLRGKFRCVAFDFPGFGLSTAAPGYGFTVAEQAEVVARFIAALDLRAIILVAHDSGGPSGLHAAGRMPERFAGIVATSTFAWRLDRDRLMSWMLRRVSGPVFRALNEHTNLLLRLMTTLGIRRRKLSAAERRGYLATFPNAETRRRIHTVFGSLVRSPDFLREVERGLGRLAHLPLLTIYGQMDPARLLGWQKRFESYFPRHHSCVARGEGHFPPEGIPDEMAAAIRAWHLAFFGQHSPLR